jgi:hypothetical protein
MTTYKDVYNAIMDEYVIFTPEVEEIIVSCPKLSYLCARDILERPWSILDRIGTRAEATIITSPEYTCRYIVNVVKVIHNESMRIMVEDIIFTCPYASYMYIRDKIKCRHAEAEMIIFTSPRYAYLYTLNIIHGRYEPVEPVIYTNNYYKYLYVLNILKEPLD